MMRIAPVLVVLASVAHAKVVDSSASGFTSKTSVVIDKPAASVWTSLVSISSWWDPSHSYSGKAENISLEVTAGGCFCEKLTGGTVEHARVVHVEADRRLRLRGELGPLGEMAVSGVLTFDLVEKNGKTTVTLTYVVGGYAPGGLKHLAKPVDGVLAHQLKRLAALK